MKFWKISGILLVLMLVAFVGFELFLGNFGTDTKESVDALKLELVEKNTLIAQYQERIAGLEDRLTQAQKEQESALLVYAEQNEKLEALLLSGARAYRVGEATYTYVVENGEITLTGYLGREEKVSVPDVIDGKRVTRIGKETFRETVVQEVVLPATVTHIDWFAFYGCFGLRSITLPTSVSKIEYGAFDGCSSSLTIKCEQDSYAQRYAKSYGLSIEVIAN